MFTIFIIITIISFAVVIFIMLRKTTEHRQSRDKIDFCENKDKDDDFSFLDNDSGDFFEGFGHHDLTSTEKLEEELKKDSKSEGHKASESEHDSSECEAEGLEGSESEEEYPECEPAELEPAEAELPESEEHKHEYEHEHEHEHSHDHNHEHHHAHSHAHKHEEEEHKSEKRKMREKLKYKPVKKQVKTREYKTKELEKLSVKSKMLTKMPNFGKSVASIKAGTKKINLAKVMENCLEKQQLKQSRNESKKPFGAAREIENFLEKEILEPNYKPQHKKIDENKEEDSETPQQHQSEECVEE